MDSTKLVDYGIDYTKGLNNCMGDADFYKKILRMFLDDKCMSLAKKAFAEGDYKELFARMHELKGVVGNAAFVTLHKASIPLVEALRNGVDTSDTATVQKIGEMFSALEKEYEHTCEGIKLFLED